MQFPVYFHVFGHTLHPHMVMEATAYAAGLGTHLAIKAKLKALGTAQQVERSLWLIAAAVTGALVGAKLLAWLENFHALAAVAATLPADTPLSALSFERLLGGKTIVGGLVGGWIGIEIAKHFTGIKQRTGDAWVFPLCLSIAIGRVGCFLTGLADQTHGNPSSLPWAVDFGDGIPRHPTQLYEIAFLLTLGLALFLYQRTAHLGFSTGRLFRLFMLAYCTWRFAVEFIKPTDKPFLGMSAIQIVSAITALICIYALRRPRTKIPPPAFTSRSAPA